MNLTCGIIQQHPGWQTLLDQAGIPWKQVHPDTPVTIDNYAVIIVNSEPTSFQQRDILHFLNNGGSVLATHGHGGSWLGSTLTTQSFTSLLPDPERPFLPDEIVDVFARGIVEQRPRFGSVEQSGAGYSILHIGNGTVVTTPFDVDALIRSTSFRRKNFYFETERLPSEIVSSVSKGEIRRFVTAMLEFLFRRRGVPFVQKWCYPDGAPSIFTFRIDSDKGSPSDVQTLYDLCDQNAIPATWFLDTLSHESWLSRFAAFRGQEIGVHCYRHTISDSLEENLSNFSLAISLLREAGITPCGAAAPFGKWNESIQQTFEKIDAAFSSEFALAYDDLPFHPRCGDRFSDLLQLPIHPVCIGSMLASRFTSQDMIRYFESVALQKVDAGEPVCFYHHPTHHHLDVLNAVFRKMRALNIPALSYSQYAAWWREREAQPLAVRFDSVQNIITSDGPGSARLWLRIVMPDGTTFLTPQQATIDCGTLRGGHISVRHPAPADLRRARAFDARHLLLSLLHTWYRWTQ
ncbi:MAG: hypothetical protein NTV54_03625 [Ignavibacteriales bacterium]|nr:hypothetical protein [Ignavibacteriales bacterium]